MPLLKVVWNRLGDGNSWFGGGKQGLLLTSGFIYISIFVRVQSSLWKYLSFLLCFSNHHKVYEPSYTQAKLKQKVCSSNTPKVPKATPTEHSGSGIKLNIGKKNNTHFTGLWMLGFQQYQFCSTELLFLGCTPC